MFDLIGFLNKMLRNTFKLQRSCQILSNFVRFYLILSDFNVIWKKMIPSYTDLIGYRKLHCRSQAKWWKKRIFSAVFWRENSKINEKWKKERAKFRGAGVAWLAYARALGL